jgi:hypothetical protein
MDQTIIQPMKNSLKVIITIIALKTQVFLWVQVMKFHSIQISHQVSIHLLILNLKQSNFIKELKVTMCLQLTSSKVRLKLIFKIRIPCILNLSNNFNMVMPMTDLTLVIILVVEEQEMV